MSGQEYRIAKLERSRADGAKVDVMTMRPDLWSQGADPECRQVTVTWRDGARTYERTAEEGLRAFALRAESAAAAEAQIGPGKSIYLGPSCRYL